MAFRLYQGQNGIACNSALTGWLYPYESRNSYNEAHTAH
ncbi:hypothetical protein FOQG_05253 [Fusarium oxysporum f. sp. raphani 54005]|uniref:Uncharacterized protein n=7 Tax=Fusarium oxysporum species complex TaxID=171631 RepID=W9I1K3_FUSOX|nr:hypothetical protein FOYG_10925 [Fusarium oxysporum NRRL 32931]EWZ31993.1 hypothetical protein FOZG_14998 [Fusarium oxysporum Fo47]EXK93023.1 hypothetical protein FOQG_05253 [Fusarium oxysporum f. sp. raphani 54005]EXL43261.1 hypothetical protein FOCG_14716 [Fusarium oxysporum f. sp. radicis-lycopersici 26381]EXL82926.1 hypothetical protein FOPG_04341 [Fusarium oxysporum f. sp. conglutinans race 2 54008]EXM26573.1 hypothetical protein FOTG_06860 [Fusarium oxysporum f. sp. vasinfectum 25433]